MGRRFTGSRRLVWLPREHAVLSLVGPPLRVGTRTRVTVCHCSGPDRQGPTAAESPQVSGTSTGAALSFPLGGLPGGHCRRGVVSWAGAPAAGRSPVPEWPSSLRTPGVS